MEVRIKQIKEIAKLSKKPKKELRNINEAQDRLYNGKDLTKYQLIYQIVFLMDAPKK